MSNSYTVKCPPAYNDGLLYHFTNAEALFKILEGMTLKLSSMSSVDDLNEKCICCRDDGWGINGINIEKYVEQECKTLSFSRNYYEGEEIPLNVQSAINLPRMWAEYADKNRGVCLIINERRFLEENQVILKNTFYDISDVEYSKMLYDDSIVASDNPEEFVKQHYKHILFRKHTDWNGQHERRFFCVGKEIEYLSIANSLDEICLGVRFELDDVSMYKLIKVLTNKQSKFHTLNIGKQCNAHGRCINVPYMIRHYLNLHMMKMSSALKLLK